MLTKESVALLEISQELKDQIDSLLNTIDSLLNTIDNQKTSYSELVQINEATGKDNERLRGELEILRTNSEGEAVKHREVKTELESASQKLQQIKARFGV